MMFMSLKSLFRNNTAFCFLPSVFFFIVLIDKCPVNFYPIRHSLNRNQQ